MKLAMNLVMVFIAMLLWLPPRAGPEATGPETPVPAVPGPPAASPWEGDNPFVSPIDPKTEETAGDCPYQKDGQWYLIDSAAGMRRLRELIDGRTRYPDGTLAREGKYRLTRDIDLSGELDPKRGWIPIGSYLDGEIRTSRQWAAFSGEFDGGGHAVTGLFITDEGSGTPHGLFGYTTDALIHDLRILDCDIRAVQGVGAVAGQNTTSGRRETGIRDCFVRGRVSGSSLVGGVLGNGESVQNCGFEGRVQGVYDPLLESPAYGTGGVAGSADIVTGCYADGSVSGYGTVGGVAGLTLRLKNCYFNGRVEGITCVGGVLGVGAAAQGCYSVADVYGFEATGGIAGHMATTYHTEPQAIDGLLTNALAAGKSINQIDNKRAAKNGSDWPVGRVVGFVGAGMGADRIYALQSMEMNFVSKRPRHSYPWDGDNFPEALLCDPTAWEEILNLDGQVWEDVWVFSEGESCPRLRWQARASLSGD